MTDYHPVTKEELEQIRYDCAFPERKDCEECKFSTTEEHSCDFDAIDIMDEVLARPDPLEVLEKWMDAEFSLHRAYPKERMQTFIKELRNSPESVIKRGKQEGWLP